ncbi:hypothetical protein LBMAG53_38000 [Planctomycetota bacterium]|nr:hypothetical protein LBMAG53_38000 [Planctomycetota bacterium]
MRIRYTFTPSFSYPKRIEYTLKTSHDFKAVEETNPDHTDKANFGKQSIVTTNIDDAECQRLLSLMEGLRIFGPGDDAAGMDGEIHGLEWDWEYGFTEVRLKWWGRGPRTWVGLPELVDFFRASFRWNR